MNRIQYPARRFLLATALALLSAGLTTPAFADELVGEDYGLRASYYLCVRDSGGDIDTMLKCVREEQKFQGERLETNYQTLLKLLSPEVQSMRKDTEESTKQRRETICSVPKGPDNTATLQRALCFLNDTAFWASEHRMVLKRLLKENKK